MPKIVKPLTAAAVRDIQPQANSVSLYDGAGLFLQVNPNGSKLWRLKFNLHGRTRLMSLGKYPEITLAKARDQRQTLRSQISQGIDPIRQKRISLATRTSNTFT